VINHMCFGPLVDCVICSIICKFDVFMLVLLTETFWTCFCKVIVK